MLAARFFPGADVTKTLACALLTGLLSLGASAQVAKELVGRYQMEVPDGDILELRADGTASLAGEQTRWSAQGGRLTVGPDVMAYRLERDRLVIAMGSVQIGWKRLAAAAAPTPMERAAAKARAPQAAAPAPQAAGHPQDEQSRQVLMGNAWCSFTYNKTSGTSTTRRVVFRPDGILAIGSGAETYSSGYGGTYAGQSSSSGAMRWRFENQRLLVDQGDGAGFQDAGLTASRNSNGYLILRADGREYSMCK